MSTVAVDPRIRARRVSVARDAGRRRLRRLLVVLAVLGLGLLGLALTWTPVLDVERVEVRGTDHTSTDAVRQAAGVAPGDPLAWFDPVDAERSVAALPWVAEARVSRSWTGAVTVAVTERVPAAALAGGDGVWRLVDGDGRVLTTVETLPADLALVDGITTSARPGDVLTDDVTDALALAAAAPDSLRPQLATVSGTGPSIEATLRSGGVIELGGVEDAAEKLRAAAAVLATVEPGCVERLDVALPAAPALVRVNTCG